MTECRPTVLTLIDYYFPGYKSGGPLRTITNMVEQMGSDIDFRIVTRDRDATDLQAYQGVEVAAWNQVGKAIVYYAPPGGLLPAPMSSLITSVQPDILYLNSFFSTLTVRCLALRRMGAIPSIPVILAPRGEFSSGALSLKSRKKRLYIAMARGIGLYSSILWQASSPVERDEIRAAFGPVDAYVAPNVPAVALLQPREQSFKRPGAVRLVFLSRISPKKNLHTLLRMLGGISGEVQLSVVGPVGDLRYWDFCQQVIRELPDNVEVKVFGPVPHQNVNEVLSSNHFFVLPTLGENFGHAILEAMAAGTPVIISDQTPWLDLARRNVGWDLPLDREDSWRETLRICVDMDNNEYAFWSASAATFAQNWVRHSGVIEANSRMFQRAIGLVNK